MFACQLNMAWSMLNFIRCLMQEKHGFSTTRTIKEPPRPGMGMGRLKSPMLFVSRGHEFQGVSVPARDVSTICVPVRSIPVRPVPVQPPIAYPCPRPSEVNYMFSGQCNQPEKNLKLNFSG